MKTRTPFRTKQLRNLIYWIEERHKMYIRRMVEKRPPPWSDDPIMRTVFFTNPYRENDKVTVWFRENMREALRNNPKVLFATIAFRRFNCIQTGKVLLARKLHLRWDYRRAYQSIKRMVEKTKQPYTSGAYMIKGGEPGEEKLDFLCRINQDVYNQRSWLVDHMERCTTLQQAHKLLQPLVNIGPFIGYEMVTDLRHTYLLERATDIDTWCSFGPGALRGMHRLRGEPPTRSKSPHMLYSMMELLEIVRNSLPDMKFEMREIEHSLCEYDKYMRVKEGGKPKRWYTPPAV